MDGGMTLCAAQCCASGTATETETGSERKDGRWSKQTGGGLVAWLVKGEDRGGARFSAQWRANRLGSGWLWWLWWLWWLSEGGARGGSNKVRGCGCVQAFRRNGRACIPAYRASSLGRFNVFDPHVLSSSSSEPTKLPTCPSQCVQCAQCPSMPPCCLLPEWQGTVT